MLQSLRSFKRVIVPAALFVTSFGLTNTVFAAVAKQYYFGQWPGACADSCLSNGTYQGCRDCCNSNCTPDGSGRTAVCVDCCARRPVESGGTGGTGLNPCSAAPTTTPTN